MPPSPARPGSAKPYDDYLKQEAMMAKGQVRSNKETRKPKKEKSVVKTTSSEGAQVKLAGSSAPLGKKDKK